MTQPIERYKRLKSNLERMIECANDFTAAVHELSRDPFTAGPSPALIEAANHVQKAGTCANDALQTLQLFAQAVGATEDAPRQHVGTVIDESVVRT